MLEALRIKAQRYRYELAQGWHGRNAISVRCSYSHEFLWFYFPVAMYRHKDAKQLQQAVRKRGDLYGLIPSAQQLIRGIWALDDKIYVDLRRDHLVVQVNSEDDWERYLPQIIELIRTSFHAPTWPVRIMPSPDLAVKTWHRRLLERSCGQVVA